jgi:hemolysin activation/secretion protein
MRRLTTITVIRSLVVALLSLQLAMAGSMGIIRVDPVDLGQPVPDPKALRAKLNSFIGQTNTESALATIADLIVAHCVANDWPVTIVTAETDPDSPSTVVCTVERGRVGQVTVTGGTESGRIRSARSMAARVNQPISALELQSDVDWFNRYPGSSAMLAAKPSADPAVADLGIVLNTPAPIRWTTAYQNNGVEPLGEHRFTTGVEWLNAFGLGHVLGLQSSSSDDPDSFLVGAIDWRIPLPWRHELQMTGYYARSKSAAEMTFLPIEVVGTTWAAGARYAVPWRINSHWKAEAVIGYELKQFDTGVTFGAIGSLDSLVGVGTAILGTRLGYEATRTSIGMVLDAHYGGEGWAEGQEDTAFAALTPDASANFGYLRGDGRWEQHYDHGWASVLRLGGQWATGPLLPSEELGLTSATTVRGYPERAYRASQAVWSSVELLGPKWTIKPAQAALITFRPTIFMDAGWSLPDRDSDCGCDAAAAEPVSQASRFSSVGVGLHVAITDHVQLRCEVAQPLDQREALRFHLAAAIRF